MFLAKTDAWLGLMALVGVVLLAYGWTTEDLPTLAIGGVLFLVAPTGFGIRSFRKPTASQIPREAFEQQIRDEPIPFSVCSQCRVVITGASAFRCPACNSLEHCITVHQEEDRSIAIAAAT
jgi:hypothetical protein